MLRELLILLYIGLAFCARRQLLEPEAIAADTGPPGPGPGVLLSLGSSARRQVVGNPGAIAAAVGVRNARSRATDRYPTPDRPPGLDPVDQARMLAQLERERRERAPIYKASACSQTPCEEGTKVEFIKGLSRNEQQVQKGETGTVIMYSAFSNMYTVTSDCQSLTMQVSAVMLQRSGSKQCPAADGEVPREVPREVYDVGQEVMTTENKTKFEAGEVGVVRKIVREGDAYKVCLDGLVQKTLAGVLTGGTKCQGGREELIAATFLKPI